MSFEGQSDFMHEEARNDSDNGLLLSDWFSANLSTAAKITYSILAIIAVVCLYFLCAHSLKYICRCCKRKCRNRKAKLSAAIGKFGYPCSGSVKNWYSKKFGDESELRNAKIIMERLNRDHPILQARGSSQETLHRPMWTFLHHLTHHSLLPTLKGALEPACSRVLSIFHLVRSTQRSEDTLNV